MKYFKFGLYAVSSKPIFNLFVIIEIAAILIAVNMTVSVANSRSVLLDPYEDIINKQGYMFIYKGEKELRNIPGRENEKSFVEITNSLKGDVSLTCTYSTTLKSDTSVLHPIDLSFDQIRMVYSFDDEIYSRFRLPLTEGRWASAKRNQQNQIEAVVAVGVEDYLKVGDVIKAEVPIKDDNGEYNYTDIGEIVIVGIIKNDYFVPDIYLQGDVDKISIKNLYQSHRKNVKEYSPAVFMINASVDSCFHDATFMRMNVVFITYNSTPAADDKAYNDSLLHSGKSTAYSLSVFNANLRNTSTNNT